ncbi:MAG: class I SAM-dependent methyltransferase family protein [Nitrososphaerota archaeon]|nr:class I SAM-dependent methyltransferase family protein [Candidatus Bathyarchaeota archaeon]MDW8048508.1 class I SAM-dependent methyltransferase family protein [Nitrososphaerota archaeon]
MVRAYCLKVPKEFGENCILLAKYLGILNASLKIRADNNFLYVPLISKPDESQLKDIGKRIENFQIQTEDFSVRKRQKWEPSEIAAEHLPPHLLNKFPRSIDFIGSIAIVEIPPELKGFKEVIGESILQANKHIHTVLAKSSEVKGVHRVRDLELVAGEPKTETVHRENGCLYVLDVKTVYFSPRLSYEHGRVAEQVKENEVVIDMFAGIGPFSILIAKTHHNVTVYAIDINPEAIRFLERNIFLNRVVGKVMPLLGDARSVIKERLRGTADRVIMNLPEKAREYLDCAIEAIKPGGGVIHYYDFVKGKNPLTRAEANIMGVLKRNGKILQARVVREVAPFKWQIVLDILIG